MLPTTARIIKGDPLPRHLQVRRILMEMVTAGIWRPGDKIPAETHIAETLGVSKMTVNKAILALTAEGFFVREIGRGTFLAGSPEAASESGGRQQATTSVQVLHVVIIEKPEFVSDNEYVCALLLGMRRCLNPMEVKIRLLQARGSDYVARWREGNSDGWVLIAPMEADVPGLRALASLQANTVVLGAAWPGVDLPCVDSDNVGGATLAVNHLAELGHRDIALLYADPQAINTQDRVRGFQIAMRERDLPLRPEWLLDAGASWGIPDAGRDVLRALLRRPDRPTAFVAAGPFIAHDLLAIANEVGVSVPDMLSIVSFDDPAGVAHATPGLTTVRQPLEEMAREAISGLRNRQDTGSSTTPFRKILPSRLLVRESTAPPAR